MSLVHLMTNRVIIARKVTTTGDRLAYSTVTAEMMNIQPAGDSASEIREGVFGKSFKLYMDGDTDIQEGDRLRDTDTGNIFTVVPDGVSRRTMGSLDFLVVVVQKT